VGAAPRGAIAPFRGPRVLESRRFPLLRLARSLELGADAVTDDRGPGTASMAGRLRSAAAVIRARGTFLEG
jgi:hypothetical protein